MFGMLLGFASWIVKRIDAQGQRIDEQGRSLSERIDEQGRSLSERIDEQGRSLGERIAGVERELVEVKVAVARLEGPRPRLVPAR
jgi:hypothetical protein